MNIWLINFEPIDPSGPNSSGYKGAEDIIGISTLLGKSAPWYLEENKDEDQEEDDNYGQKKTKQNKKNNNNNNAQKR